MARGRQMYTSAPFVQGGRPRLPRSIRNYKLHLLARLVKEMAGGIEEYFFTFQLKGLDIFGHYV